jgi:hypothetical protein
MIEIYVRLVLDGADGVPALTIAQEVETFIAGSSIRTRNEDGTRADVVIDEAVAGDFASYVPEDDAR